MSQVDAEQAHQPEVTFGGFEGLDEAGNVCQPHGGRIEVAAAAPVALDAFGQAQLLVPKHAAKVRFPQARQPHLQSNMDEPFCVRNKQSMPTVAL